MKRGKPWKFCLVFLLLFLVSSLLYAESETETIEIPNLEPEAIYEMTGEDVMGLYQELNNLMLLKNDYKNVAIEILELAKDAETLARELEKKNNKLILQNKFLIGTTVCSVSVVITGVVIFMVMNIN